MAFTVQNEDGTVEAANAYVTAADFKAWTLDRGLDMSATPDNTIQAKIIAATDFMDSAYAFIGTQLREEQGTAWPRYGVFNVRQRGLPAALKKACYQLTLKAVQNIPLVVDPTLDPSGLAVASSTVKVGPIEKSTSFFQATGGASPDVLSKRFPEIELGLRQAGLLLSRNGGALVRA